MIDVGGKIRTQRVAEARAIVKLNNELVKKIKGNKIPKGNVLEAARIAGILSAKKTPELIPLCHNIELDQVAVDFKLRPKEIEIIAVAKAEAKTGVEMEAIVACTVAAITIYDMCKMFSKSIQITGIELLKKSGGKSGDYTKRKVK